MATRLDPGGVLAHVRPLIVVIDREGNVTDAYGAHGGVAGYQSEDLVGHHALDFVSEADRQELMHMFLPGRNLRVLTTPSPFPIRMVGPNDERELVDVLPRGFDDHGGGYVLTIMPRCELPTPVKVLDLIIDGASLDAVLSELVTHQASSIREAKVDPHIILRPDRPDRVIISSKRNRCSETLTTLVDSGNDRMWNQMASGSTREYEISQLPPILRATAEREGCSSCTVTRVDVDGRLECVMVTLITDPARAAKLGNVAINQREQIRIITHAVRRDVADRALRAAALEDSLTGLSNRGRFDQLLSAFDGVDATLLFIDLDHFKSVNDRYGHDVGDQVLIEVANRLRSCCRPADVIARIGGDEFAVLLTDTDESTARSISDRLLAAICEPLPSHLGPESISASVGFARHVSPTNPTDLLHAADRAMLRGKRSGRARVVMGG
jgi:diguanylate cyclase (GGDEF)-like protein